jgi:hypothetical protein
VQQMPGRDAYLDGLLGGGIVAGHSSTGHGTATRRATIWTARLTWSHAAARVA